MLCWPVLVGLYLPSCPFHAVGVHRTGRGRADRMALGSWDVLRGDGDRAPRSPPRSPFQLQSP